MYTSQSLVPQQNYLLEITYNDVFPAHITNYLFLQLLDLKNVNPPAFEHSVLVSRVCKSLAPYFDHLSDDASFLNELSLAGLVHDLGKKDSELAELTLKSSCLSLKEFEKVKKHTLIGAQIILDMPIDEECPDEVELKNKLEAVVLGHHTWFDETSVFSYPKEVIYDESLKLYPQIVMMADTFSACVDKQRVYKNVNRTVAYAYTECLKDFERGKLPFYFRKSFEIWFENEVRDKFYVYE